MDIEYINAKTILSNAKSSNWWFHYDYNMNIYKGCCHGCIYCDSRSDCYHIENFDKVRAKENVIELLNSELSKKRKKGIVCTGAMSDPYNPLEEKLELTRKALELLSHHNFGVIMFTKSNLITRDIDILKKINRYNPVACCITITCGDDELSKIIEPNVSVSSERFNALKEISKEGIFAGVLLTPILPFINDTEENIRNIVHLAKKNGAKFIYPSFGVTLRSNQRYYFYEKLDKYFPGIKNKYMDTYGDEYNCKSPNLKSLWKVFKEECEATGILYKLEDIIKEYKREDLTEQLTLF